MKYVDEFRSQSSKKRARHESAFAELRHATASA